ncbi:hypothetical protein GGI43DRAFT_271474 [Trichoderma evansii]
MGPSHGICSQPQSEASSQDENSQNSSPARAINADRKAIGTIEDVVEKLNGVLKKAQTESEKLKHNDVDSECSLASEDSNLTPSRFKRLNMKMRNIVEKRCQKANTQVEGLKWALYKKDQCESIMTQLSDTIGQLEGFVEPQSKLNELIQEDTKAIGESLETFLEIVGKCDPRLEESAKQTLADKEEMMNISMSATNISLGCKGVLGQ